MTWRFNPPPGWPQPPPGWTPPQGWQPDPAWPPAPPGWEFWLQDPPTVTPAQGRHEAKGTGGSFLGSRKRGQELEADNLRLQGERDRLAAENARLQEQLAALGAMDELERARRRDELARQCDELGRQVHARREELDRLGQEVVVTSDAVLLQQVGVYEYRHPLEHAEAYKAALEELRQEIRDMVKADAAVEATTGFTVSNSARKGQAMLRQTTKLMLRAYNAEADTCVRTLRDGTLATAEQRLEKAALTIAQLGKVLDIRVAEGYHLLRLRELALVADFLHKKAEEREAERADQERRRDAERAERELRQERERLEGLLRKEREHYRTLAGRGDAAAAEQARAKVEEIEQAIAGVEAREANIRAGYVYVISNVGAFGEGMVKVGLTRRLDPTERIRELGDASVPFRFDVHALVFSDDAVGLEARLHQELRDARVNLVNQRREFFYATPAEVKALLKQHAGYLLEFVDEPEAPEWRQSEGERQRRRLVPRPSDASVQGSTVPTGRLAIPRHIGG
jgi:Domain of unknown function (DUF4041)/T5orf172 domain